MSSAAVSYDLGTENTRGQYISDSNGSPRNMTDISFRNGRSTIELEYPAEVAITKSNDGKVTIKYGWGARSAVASELTTKVTNLKSVFDNSTENKPARRAMVNRLNPLDISPSALLRGYYTSLYREQESWLKSTGRDAPKVCWFTVPAINQIDTNEDNDTNKHTAVMRVDLMITLLKEAGFVNAQISTTECEARIFSIVWDCWKENKDIEARSVAVIDLGAGTGQITAHSINRKEGEKGGFLAELKAARCIGQGGEAIKEALEKWMLSKFPDLTDWQISTARLHFYQKLKQFTVDDPDWQVDLLQVPQLTLTAAEMKNEICSSAYKKICEFIEANMDTFKLVDRVYFVGGTSSSHWFEKLVETWTKDIQDKVIFYTARCTQVAEGSMLAGMKWITISMRITNGSYGLGVGADWADILDGRRRPKKKEIEYWGGNKSAPGLIIQPIKNKGDEIATSPEAADVLWMERKVSKEDPYITISFAMAKENDIKRFSSESLLYKFSSEKFYQWLWCPEIDLRDSEELPDKPKTIHFCFRIYADGFTTKFQLEANDRWIKNDNGLKPFVEGCLEEILSEDLIDSAAEKSSADNLDTLLRAEFESELFENSGTRGIDILDEPEAGSDQATSNLPLPSPLTDRNELKRSIEVESEQPKRQKTSGSQPITSETYNMVGTGSRLDLALGSKKSGDKEHITAIIINSINGPSGTVLGGRAHSTPPSCTFSKVQTGRRATSVGDIVDLPDDALRPSEADVQLQLEYITCHFPTDEDSKMFKEYHLEQIKERRSVIVSLLADETSGVFSSFMKEFMQPMSATQIAPVDFSTCFACRYYDDQKLGSCGSRDSRDSLCIQSRRKGRPTIFEHVEMSSPQDGEIVQGVTWFVVPVHENNKLWRQALTELKRQDEELK